MGFNGIHEYHAAISPAMYSLYLEHCMKTVARTSFPGHTTFHGHPNSGCTLALARLRKIHSTCLARFRSFFSPASLYSTTPTSFTARHMTAPLRERLYTRRWDALPVDLRARNILQHGLKWMKEERFFEGLDPIGKAMVGEVGYSLDG